MKENHSGTIQAKAENAAPQIEVPGEPPLLDLGVLAKVLGPDPAKLCKFARKFLDSAQQGLLEIEAALQKRDFPALGALGHRNKSPARTVGAMQYGELCLALEKFKQGGEAAEAEKIVIQMKAMLQQIRERIEMECK